MDIATFMAQNPWLLPFLLTVGLPVVGTNVAAILRQKGFAPPENALIAWSVLIIVAVGVALLEGIFVGGLTSVFAAFCAIVSLLLGGALHALSPYLMYLDWVEAHIFNVVQPVVIVSTQTRVKAVMKAQTAEALVPTPQITTGVAGNVVVKEPSPIILPPVALTPGLAGAASGLAGAGALSFPLSFVASPQEVPVTLAPQLPGGGTTAWNTAPPPSASVQLPPGFSNLSELNMTYPMAAINRPQPPGQ